MIYIHTVARVVYSAWVVYTYVVYSPYACIQIGTEVLIHVTLVGQLTAAYLFMEI